jgi:hypothetical protein
MSRSAALKIAPEPREMWLAETPRPRPRPSRVRYLTEDDIEAVSDLFLQRFRPARRSARARREVADYMKSLYLDAPRIGSDPGSLILRDENGAVAAFVGCNDAPFRFDGAAAKVGVSGTLMASADPRHALAAVQIIRESRKLDYDLISTDSANRASLAMCQALNYQVVSPESLEWAFVFDPVSLALHKARKQFGASLLGALRPLARGADLVASACLRAASGAQKRNDWRDEVVEADRFIEIAPRFLDSFRLRPDYSPAEWRWLIAKAGERRSAGPLSLRVVYDSKGEPAAAYAVYGARGDVARVLHAAAAPHAWGRMLDKMLETARETGCIAIHGALRRPLMPHAYAVRGMFCYYAHGTLTYANRPEIRRAIEVGESFLGGFAGDRWTRLASDVFG